MRSLFVPLLLAPLLAMAPPAAACPPTFNDDGAHSAGHAGTVVSVNGAEVQAICFGHTVEVAESWSQDAASPTCTVSDSDDATHSVTQDPSGVHFNLLALRVDCLPVRADVRESWSVP